MPLRVGFDLDGVLADLQSAIGREADCLFPRINSDAKAPSSDAARADIIAEVDGQLPRRRRNSREEKRLWEHLAGIHNFWETLDEVEEGAVACLAKVAAERRWEVIFLTKRPQTAGATAQLQSQRWLAAKGFRLPAVCVVQRSRGAIATALGLQAIVDDRLENCLDVLADSHARVFLRCATPELPIAPRRIAIQPVTSMAMCLEFLIAMDTVSPPASPTGESPSPKFA